MCLNFFHPIYYLQPGDLKHPMLNTMNNQNNKRYITIFSQKPVKIQKFDTAEKLRLHSPSLH